ncbi:methylamine utilization protein [Sphingomonas sp.]|uniref:methylamine utilization protein n=1 Tax=Sphingomonas sp. TaxID=28214 RepID=UPI0025CE9647|nr:methylamine utilization protein [Sphingomonas sp.]MBV9527214.1 methylamine utilization protein [Sphingomonas sp.]
MVRGILTFAAGVSLSAAAHGAPLSVRVVDSAGKPVQNAVVTYYPADAAMARPAQRGGRYVVAQRNLQFQPFLSIVPLGADVSFPNFDPTKHHVYSFSPAKKFELKLFAKDQSRTVRFDKAGVVALGCNIHDQMTAFIVVTDSAWTARTNGQGIAALGDVPGAGRVTIWQPYLRAPSGMLQGNVTATQHLVNVTVRLRPPPTPMTMPDY